MSPPAWTGLALVALGFSLRAWAIRHLWRAGTIGDRFYGCATPPNGYTSHGPYRWLRHPAYVGSGAILIGAGLLAFGWAGFVLALPAWPFFVDRAQAEERLRAAWLRQRGVERMREIEDRMRPRSS